MKINSRDGINHVEPHLHGVPGVVPAGLWEAGHAVVAVSEDLYTETFVVLRSVN